jgi:hypothetical protein
MVPSEYTLGFRMSAWRRVRACTGTTGTGAACVDVACTRGFAGVDDPGAGTEDDVPSAGGASGTAWHAADLDSFACGRM